MQFESVLDKVEFELNQEENLTEGFYSGNESLSSGLGQFDSQPKSENSKGSERSENGEHGVRNFFPELDQPSMITNDDMHNITGLGQHP